MLPLVHRALLVVSFESWKDAVGRFIREEVRRGVLSSVTDFVRDEAVKLLSSNDSEMEKKTVYRASVLRQAIVSILVLNSPNYTRQQNFTFFGTRGKISNPNRAFNAEFKYVSSFSPSPTVCL